MNNERLTELDVKKVYVNGYGQKWAYESGLWRMNESSCGVYDNQLLILFPDLREHVPAWYEDAVAKGPWVVIHGEELIACLGANGYSLRIRTDLDRFRLVSGKFGENAIKEYCTLDECLAAAEPLIWKGEAK